MIYDTFNPVILDFIEKYGKDKKLTILDVGCGTGILGKCLKKTKKDCFVIGIEIDEEAAALAREFYDEVYVLDLEDYSQNQTDLAVSCKYDFIIYGDILEHVSKPEILIQKFDKFLKDDGLIIASIPNPNESEKFCVLGTCKRSIQ